LFKNLVKYADKIGFTAGIKLSMFKDGEAGYQIQAFLVSIVISSENMKNSNGMKSGCLSSVSY
jgi:hypothetical protein